MENRFGFSRPGQYNKVALLIRWLLDEVSLYSLLELYNDQHFCEQSLITL